MRDQPEEMVRACIRGTRPWADLRAVGIELKTTGSILNVENPHNVVATATPTDVAEGFVRLASDPDRLREWASMLLEGSSFIDLKLEGQAYGEALLNGLWEASAGEPLRESAVLAARELFSLS